MPEMKIWERVNRDVENKFFPGKPEEIQALTGDAGTREYYRLVFSHRLLIKNLNYSARTLLYCYWPLSKGLKEKKAFQNYLFLTEFLSKNDIRVPTLIKQADDNSYYLEDLGSKDLEKFAPKEYSYKAIDSIKKFHSLNSLKEHIPLFTKRWRYKELLFFLKQSRRIIFSEEFKHYVKETGEKNLKYSSSELLGLVKCFFKNISLKSYADEKRFVASHRDFHCRNTLLFRGDIYLIDFQDAFSAPPEYDLASFLWDPYKKTESKLRWELLDFYYGKDIDIDTKNILYYNILQRLYKALGTYLFQISLGKFRYLPSLKAALEYLNGLKQEFSEKFPEEILYFNMLLEEIYNYLITIE